MNRLLAGSLLAIALYATAFGAIGLAEAMGLVAVDPARTRDVLIGLALVVAPLAIAAPFVFRRR